MIEFVIEKLVEYPFLNIINHNISSLGNPYFSTGKIYWNNIEKRSILAKAIEKIKEKNINIGKIN